jgi:2-oxoglutarate ferredoxin oxidoreductase subunit delta
VSKGRVVFDENRCKGCELCIGVCPQDVIRIADRFNVRGYRPATLVDPAGKCTGCAMCAVICPDVVITVYRWEKPRGQRGQGGQRGQMSPLTPLSPLIL